jgi:hypothetical protein
MANNNKFNKGGKKELKTVGWIYDTRADGSAYETGYRRLIIEIDGTRHYLGVMPNQFYEKVGDAKFTVFSDGYTQPVKKDRSGGGSAAPKKAAASKTDFADF